MASTENDSRPSDVTEHDVEHNQSCEPLQVQDGSTEPTHRLRRISRKNLCVVVISIILIVVVVVLAVALAVWSVKRRNDALALSSTQAKTWGHQDSSVDYFVNYDGVCPPPVICQLEIVGRTSRFEERHCEADPGILSNETKCLECGDTCITAESLIPWLGKHFPCNNAPHVYNHYITCCTIQSLVAKDICGGHGNYSCREDLRPPECNCLSGWNGTYCSHKNSETVDCKCLKNGKRIMQEFMHEPITVECNNETRPSNWRRCHIEIENDTCICAPLSEGFVTYGEDGPEMCNARRGQNAQLSVRSGQNLGPPVSYLLTCMCVFVTVYENEMAQQLIKSLTNIT
ncbi:uncharacterized protein LOC127838045 isoform X1 [Dreissena polymorpha]|uniref:uncharacterized protein LOC127838045 isoform X1 n=1 Tax=Dreissena polymorpha TaxID=45954 RepID=UPI0022652135|nr:uncharacterized protein LOC127838045 isoform X1 [Dreissena polymorpha]